KSRSLRVDPALALDWRSAVLRATHRWPDDRDDWMLNSPAGLVCCCYIEQLGKVMTLWSGAGAHHQDSAFKKFANELPGFREESDRRGGRGSLDTLYTAYRNGFVHRFGPESDGWCREEERIYWCDRHDGHLSINIDR